MCCVHKVLRISPLIHGLISSYFGRKLNDDHITRDQLEMQKKKNLGPSNPLPISPTIRHHSLKNPVKKLYKASIWNNLNCDHHLFRQGSLVTMTTVRVKS